MFVCVTCIVISCIFDNLHFRCISRRLLSSWCISRKFNDSLCWKFPSSVGIIETRNCMHDYVFFLGENF